MDEKAEQYDSHELSEVLKAVDDAEHDLQSLNRGSSLRQLDGKLADLQNCSLACDFVDDQEEFKRKRVLRVLAACDNENFEELATLSISPGGFADDETRKIAWPFLLGCRKINRTSSKEKPHSYESNSLVDEQLVVDRETKEFKYTRYTEWHFRPPHRNEEQVKLDVNRAFVYYPRDQTVAELDARKASLQKLIISVLRQHPCLHYFQGYHDIASVMLLVLGDDGIGKSGNVKDEMIDSNDDSTIENSVEAGDDKNDVSPSSITAEALARLSLLRIRDFMLPTLDAALAQLALLPAILRAADPALARHLINTQPFYALAGTITMYAHEVQGYGDIARLFDYLLAHEAVLSIYLFATTLLQRRENILELDDPADLHAVLSHLPSPLCLENLIRESHVLYRQHPPSTLHSSVLFPLTSTASTLSPLSSPPLYPFATGWPSISPDSALKTTRDVSGVALQSTSDGERWFARLEEQMRVRKRRQELWIEAQRKWQVWKGPAFRAGMAVAVALLAVAVSRRSGGFGAGLGGHFTI